MDHIYISLQLLNVITDTPNAKKLTGKAASRELCCGNS